MKRCAIYARVSTDQQGESLDNQVVFAQEFIDRFLGDDYVLDNSCIYQDFDMSGYYTRFIDRDAIRKALEDAGRKRFDVIVFKELSRISRDQAEHLEIIGRFNQCGVRLIGINDNLDTDNQQSMDFLGIRSWMAEMESKRISSRVSSAKKAIARRGLWVGEPPIGYTLDTRARKLVISEYYEEIIKTIFDMYVSGQGAYKIAEYLNRSGRYTKNGKLWSRSSVTKVVKNPAYIGATVYGRSKNELRRFYTDSGYVKKQGREHIPPEKWVWVDGTHEPIIDRSQYDAAQKILNMRSHSNPRRSKHPLSGILKCGKCGVGMICQKRSVTQASGNRYDYRYYYCASAFKHGRHVCEQTSVIADNIERGMLEQLRRSVGKYIFSMYFNEEDTEPRRKSIAKNRILSHTEVELKKTQTALNRLLMDTDIPESTFNMLKEQYVKDIQRLELQIAQIKETVLAEEKNGELTDYLNDLWKRIETIDPSDLEQLRKLFDESIESVVINGKEIADVSLKIRIPKFS